MSSSNPGFNLALLTLNLSKNDFDKMNRNDIKQYINNFFENHVTHINDVNLDKYKLASQVLLDNKSSEKRNNNQLSLGNFDPFFEFNNHLNNHYNMMSNFNRQFNSNFMLPQEQSQEQPLNVNNSYMKTYSKTYVNNNGNGFIKEEKMERNNNEKPNYQSVYKKIENGKLINGVKDKKYLK
jgi:hypothetical protein